MVFERKGFSTEMVSNKGRIALQAGHASPVKWCLKEKVLLGKWSAIAMLELQRIRFAGWALTEGQRLAGWALTEGQRH